MFFLQKTETYPSLFISFFFVFYLFSAVFLKCQSVFEEVLDEFREVGFKSFILKYLLILSSQFLIKNTRTIPFSVTYIQLE